MGSVIYDSPQHHAGPDVGHLNGLAVAKTNGHVSIKSVGVELEPVSVSTPTTVTEEILLASWLVVLMRTREDNAFTYEWGYHTEETGDVGASNVMRLAANEIMPGLDTSLEQVATAIFRHIKTSPPRPTPCLGSVSLLLSTGSLSKTPEGDSKDEPLLHLEAKLDDARVELRQIWHSEDMLPFTVRRHVESLADTVKLCMSNPNASIQTLLGPTTHELDEIWRWNHQLPPTYDLCMHDVISQVAKQQPDHEAISSWDGSLTYGQIEQYSTFLAGRLRTELGVNLHDVVPICFEKSRWTIVAVLAVMKSGATMVLMDPTLPLARLQNMREQVGAKAMVSSRAQHDLAQSIMPDGASITVEPDTFTCLSDPHQQSPPTTPDLPQVPPSTLMYIIFTSGSTGTPKGVKISHATYSSSAFPRAAAVGYAQSSRVLDFASYAFDVSIDSMLLTLANGGCLCIPSDEDRLNDINGVMRDMRVNYAGITPSVARILDVEVIAALTGGLGLGGEAVSARDANNWGRYARIIIGYGPCECTIGCTVNSSAATGRDYISIGPGNGAAIWVVDPNDHEKLMPVGAVGELLVEGPIVGQGYLNDPGKSAAAFIEDPVWLTGGHGQYQGRRGRLYKTGDLGRYDPDGSGGIVFVGRKDTQVKLRGQRVELGEIESQLRARLPQDTNIIAEVIVPQGSSSRGQPTLVAFISPQSVKAQGQDADAELESAELPAELRDALSKADTEIGEVLPRYMVPTAYIPVNRIPTLISGKTDRKRLRQFGASVDLRQLTADQGATTEEAATQDRPLNEMEQRLRQAWAVILKRHAESIRADDNFFVLGGDSLAAMKLVSVCREGGLDLSVTSTFGHPTLAAMAAMVTSLGKSRAVAQVERAPFSLIPQPVENAIAETGQICGTEPTAVEDIYPCTPTQESLFTFSLKSAEPYIAQRVACIPPHISLDAWKNAWEIVVAATPILRSRLVQLGDHASLGQVVLKEGIQWKHSTADLEQFLKEDRNDKMNLGQSLARYAIVQPTSSPDKRYMVWTLHHAVYDGWSEPLVLAQVRDILHGTTHPLATRTTMGDFVQHIRAIPPTSLQTFWRTQLDGAVGPQFPRVPSRDFFPIPDTLLERRIALPAATKSLPFTLATLIRGAWSLLSSHYSQNPDVVFGETLTGRDIALPGVEAIAGPLIATIPVRVRVDYAATVREYLQAIQQGCLERAPYQHMGMQHIRRVSRDAQYACEAPTGLVIQPEGGDDVQGVVRELGFEVGDVVREAVHFNPYPLMVACGIDVDGTKGGGFRVCASFDGRVVDRGQMERMLSQLEVVCGELAAGDLDSAVGKVRCLPAEELERIWEWNRLPPLRAVTGSLRTDSTMQPGMVYHARAGIPWVCDLHSPDLLAPIGCPGELWLEGDFLTGDNVVETPGWLLAGSSRCPGRIGHVQPTGDVVKLQEDGSLVFLGRKDETSAGQGNAADSAELEAHFRSYLPSSVRAAAVPVQGATKQELRVFVECSGASEQDQSVQILSNSHNVAIPDSTMTVCAAVPASLAAALKRLDKFVQNSLASHLVPSAYVIVDKMPVDGEQVDRSALQQLASNIPREILSQVRQGFRAAWAKGLQTQTTTTTTAEDILRSCWARVLGLNAAQIDVDDNFFRLGGDSVLAMKLASRLRGEGHGLTVADIFRHMRLGDAAKVLKMNQYGAPNGTTTEAPRNEQAYQPFSMLGSPNAETLLTEVVRPQLDNEDWAVQDVYPVTDSQTLDVEGTINPPRTSTQYTMLSSDKGFDLAQLLKASRKLVQTHDILRTVFVEHESTFLQVVLKDLDVPVVTHLAEHEDLEKSAHDLCAAHIESGAFRLGSPFFHLFLVQGKDSQAECLVIGLSHAQYDGVSLPLLLRDFETLYTGKEPAPSSPFSSYVSLTRDQAAQEKALSYWRALLKGSSLSILPDQSTTTSSKALFLSNAVPNLPSAQHNTTTTTTATLLTAAWALVLARRLHTPDITFGSITSGRALAVPNTDVDTDNIVGPCYQFTPVRIPFRRDWSSTDLLQFVQSQSAESMGYDFVGFGAIAKTCGWLSGEQNANGGNGNGRKVFFDSVVHHQDWDDFDVMPFAGGECKVGIVNPHGDAPWPMKVVSFVREGEMHVGVVGCEEDRGLVEGLLGELTAAVGELVVGDGEGRLLEGVFVDEE